MKGTLKRRLVLLCMSILCFYAAVGGPQRALFAIQRKERAILASQRTIPGQRGLPPPEAPSSGRGRDGGPTGLIPEIDGAVLRQDGVFDVTDPRPLQQAAALLERKLGVPISYEDPLWASSRDTVNASRLPGNRELARRHPNWKGNLVPRGGMVTVIVPTTAEAKQATNPVYVMQAAISSYEAQANPGQFTLVRFGENEFSIVPTKAEDKGGRLVDQISPLDLKISFPEEERSLLATIDVISRAIGVRPIRFDSSPHTYFRSTRVRVGAQNETAREVLARTLRIPGGPKFSFQLNYMPDVQTYVIGLNPVRVEVPTPKGVKLETLYWPR
jgi:hypothetical protein